GLWFASPTPPSIMLGPSISSTRGVQQLASAVRDYLARLRALARGGVIARPATVVPLTQSNGKVAALSEQDTATTLRLPRGGRHLWRNPALLAAVELALLACWALMFGAPYLNFDQNLVPA